MDTIEILLPETKTATELFPEMMVEEAGYTFVHCLAYPSRQYTAEWWVNIWRTTFLVDTITGDSLELLFADKIPYAPDRHYFKHINDTKTFLLVFTKIPKTWRSFHVIEKSNDGDCFETKYIQRNDSGVYYINL